MLLVLIVICAPILINRLGMDALTFLMFVFYLPPIVCITVFILSLFSIAAGLINIK